MTLLKKARFICLDCEFTGLDLDNDRLLEVAAARFTFDEIQGTIDELVKPDCPISPESQAIHNISAEMVENRPPIEEILPSFLEFVGRDLIMGHGVGADLEMITRAAKRANIPCSLQARPYIDTLRLARLYGDSPNNSLSNLAKHFNIPADPAHRALNDVMMNIEVFKHLVTRFKTVEQVMEILAKPIKMKFMPLGKHKGRPFGEIPEAYLRWAAGVDFDQDLLYSIRLELKKRKKGGGFSQANNPFGEL